jgi:hypothetical protein
MAQADEIDGGLHTGIRLKNAKISTSTSEIECADLVTDFKFIDLVIPRIRHYYNIYLNDPKIVVKKLSKTSGFRVRMPLWLKTHLFITNAQVSIKDKEQEFTLGINGVLDIDRKSIKVSNWKMQLDKLEIVFEGGMDRNKQLDLSAQFVNSDNKFLIKGTIGKPQIYTKWGNLETIFTVEGLKFQNKQLLLPKIEGNINIQGFPPIDFLGELCVSREFIKFCNMTLLGLINVNGVIYPNKFTKLRLLVNDIDGSEFAEKLPDSLKVFIKPHKVSADLSIYGMTSNLQGGGILKLHSTPIELACRYRQHRFSFRSINDSPFSTSGSINWFREKSLKIKGLFKKMEMKDFIGVFGNEPNGKCKGIVDGKFKISGDAAAPLIESKLEIQDAEFGSIKFDVAYLNLQGTGFGQLNLQHSMVYYKEVPAELKGYIDPKSKDMFRNLEICPTSERFIIEGINIEKGDQDKVVTFEKELNEKIKVHFKSAVTSDPESNGEETDPEIKLEYQLNKNKNIMIKMQEDEGTVGLEQKVKF